MDAEAATKFQSEYNHGRFSQLNDVVIEPITQTLCLFKDEEKSMKIFSTIHVGGHELAVSPMDIVPFRRPNEI